MQETEVQSLGPEDPLETGMATLQYSCLENPWTEEPGGLYSPWGLTGSDMTEQLKNKCGCHGGLCPLQRKLSCANLSAKGPCGALPLPPAQGWGAPDPAFQALMLTGTRLLPCRPAQDDGRLHGHGGGHHPLRLDCRRAGLLLGPRPYAVCGRAALPHGR